MYGIQTAGRQDTGGAWFENDVNMYGIQTELEPNGTSQTFENDVNMYGIQTNTMVQEHIIRLRMM